MFILVIDDSPGQPIGTEIQAILEQKSRYRAVLANAPLRGLPYTDDRPGLFIPVLPTCKGIAEKLLASISEADGTTPLLPVLPTEELNFILDDLPIWTEDFLVPPLRAEEVLSRVRRLLSRTKRHGWNRSNDNLSRSAGLANLVGEDPAFEAVKHKLPLIARYGAPVLLTGETGTGKELCARALHYLSARAGRPFLPVNCGAIPVDLFESELFGHYKGAFTSAWTTQKGLIEEAAGGTLFLDEIDSLPPAAQVKLLRFIENHTYHALGSAKERRADVWIIAASNGDLKEKIHQGSFREDLYYRLSVMNLSLPPLRDRRADIPLLVHHFWCRYAQQLEGDDRPLSARALETLCHYNWPGNIRELENVIQQLLVLTDAQAIEPEDLPIPAPTMPIASSSLSFNQAKAQVIANFERAYVAELLRISDGNVTRAAREAKKERRSFGRLIKKYQLGKVLPTAMFLFSDPSPALLFFADLVTYL